MRNGRALNGAKTNQREHMRLHQNIVMLTTMLVRSPFPHSSLSCKVSCIMCASSFRVYVHQLAHALCIQGKQAAMRISYVTSMRSPSNSVEWR